MLKGIPALTHVIHVTQIVLLEVVDHQHHHAMHVDRAVQTIVQMVPLGHLVYFVHHALLNALENALVRAQGHALTLAVVAQDAPVNVRKIAPVDVKVNV